MIGLLNVLMGHVEHQLRIVQLKLDANRIKSFAQVKVLVSISKNNAEPLQLALHKIPLSAKMDNVSKIFKNVIKLYFFYLRMLSNVLKTKTITYARIINHSVQQT